MSYPPRLERALATWQQWPLTHSAPPTVEQRLSGGLTNESWLVTCGEQRVVVRLNSERSAQLNIDRQRERQILLALETLDIAPRWIFHCPASDATVLEYLDGRVWTADDLALPEQQQKIQQCIASYQNADLPLPRFAYLQHMQQYWRELKTVDPVSASKHTFHWHRFEERLQHWENENWSPVLCHHDLNPSNIIDMGERVKLIDWEYAGMGFADFDHYYLFATNKAKVLHPSGMGSDKREQLLELIFWLEELWTKVNEGE